jgi:hypothetical protein
MVGFRMRGGFVRSISSASLLALLALGAVGGCAGQSTGSGEDDRCPESCARGRKCPGVEPSQRSCDDECLGQDALALQSGCHEEYLRSVECLVELEDICTGLTACKTELLAAQACERAYCQAHQNEDVCAFIPTG